MKYLEFYRQRIKNLPTPNEHGEVVVPCVFHVDGTASLSVNLATGKWKCFAPHCPGHRGGSYKKFAALQAGETTGVPTADAKLEPALVDGYHNVLLQTSEALGILRARGLNEETIARYRLGYDGDRILIPIWSETGELVNFRKYKAGAKDKMIPYSAGLNKPRLFPASSLAANTVLLAEGEWDALLLCQHGYSAVTSTGGADSWRPEFTDALRGKTIYIVYDCDAAGRKGAARAAMRLLPVAAAVYKVTLPLSGTKAEKDVTDYFVACHNTRDQFQELLDRTAKVVPILEGNVPDDEVKELHLSEIGLDRYVNKRVAANILVAGKDLAPYQVPWKVAFSCPMGEKICDRCGIAQAGGQRTVQLEEWRPELIEMVGVPNEKVRQVLGLLAGVPTRCQKYTHEVQEFANVESVKAIPEIDFTSERAQYVIRQLFYLGHGLEPNHTYAIDAVVMPDPKTQYATAIIYAAESSQDSLERYVVNPEVDAMLRLFEVGQ